tara:strand:+ start:1184 stop:2080 length:897 start_codon:yes stop_codon:yes gene_type:complete
MVLANNADKISSYNIDIRDNIKLEADSIYNSKPYKDKWMKTSEYNTIYNNFISGLPINEIIFKVKLNIKMPCDRNDGVCYNVDNEKLEFRKISRYITNITNDPNIKLTNFKPKNISVPRDYLRNNINYSNLYAFIKTDINKIAFSPGYLNSEIIDIILMEPNGNIAASSNFSFLTKSFFNNLEIINLEDLESDYSIDSSTLPILKVAPIYPRRALERGTEGFVTTSFTITESGSVRDVIVIEGYCGDPDFPNQSRECSIFNSASLRASLKLKYKPKIVDGKATPVENVLHRFTFKLDK